MAASPPEPSGPLTPLNPTDAADGPEDIILPDWAQATRRRRAFSRRNLLIGAAIFVILGFVVWLNFPFIPDPVILLTRQPDVLLDSGSGGANWTMAGRSIAQTRYAADALQPPAGRLAWSADAGEPTLAAPVVSDGRIYLPAHFRIAVLDAATGAELDSIPTSGPMHNSIALVGDTMYYATIDRRLVARERDGGQIRWEYPIGDSASGPVAVAGGIVYAGALNGATYAVNATTGEHIWRHTSLSEVRSPVAVANQVVYVASADRSLYALDSRTGQERARFRTPAQLVAPPVTAGGLAYFVAGGQLFAMAGDVLEYPGRYAVTSTWSQLWLWGFPLPSPPSQPGDRWRFNPEGKSFEGIITAPAADDDTLYAGDLLGVMHAVDRLTGEERWRFAAADAIVASPVLVGDTLVFGDKSGALYALNRSDGQQQWRLQLPAAIRTAPIYADGQLLVRTDDGRLHAIE